MQITIDIQKAKEIHRNYIRRARESKLQELDVQFQRELEKGSNANVDPIVSQKQQLRDAPSDSRIDAASTPEELKLLWPTDLLGESPYRPLPTPEPPKVTTRVRARNEDGTFKSDDPSTPDVNEAWETP